MSSHRSFWRWEVDQRQTELSLQPIVAISLNVRMIVCSATYGVNPVESICGCFHLCGQAGGCDHIGGTVSVDGCHTLIFSESPPWLLFAQSLTFQYHSSRLPLKWSPFLICSLMLSVPSETTWTVEQHNVRACMQTWSVSNLSKKKFCLDSNGFGFICAGISNVGGYKRNAWYKLSCLLQIYCHLMSVSWQFLETYGITNYCSGWRKGVINECLGFVFWLNYCFHIEILQFAVSFSERLELCVG